jgi:hypothetical protein
MYLLETLKKTFEQVTGIGKPSSASMHRFIRRRKAHASMFSRRRCDTQQSDPAVHSLPQPGASDQSEDRWRGSNTGTTGNAL